eukprot:420480_1
MEIPLLGNINVNDWIDVWITSIGNNNIQIGIGNVIGNENDVIFSYDYNTNMSYANINLEYGWIGTSIPYSTNWIFYDYNDSNICDIEFIKQNNITKDLLNYVYKYELMEYENIQYVEKGLWNNMYLMFEILSTDYTWIIFEMEIGNNIKIELGKKDIMKFLCGSRGDDINYYVIINNECSEYNDYDIQTNSWLFWIKWNYGVLEIGNGDIIGQSIIMKKENIFHNNIKSVRIGCNKNEICEWIFYTLKQQLVLISSY